MDTVYATVGKKPALFRLLIEMAISVRTGRCLRRSGTMCVRSKQSWMPAGSYRYMLAIRSIQARLAPLFRVLQGAAALDAELNELWQSISERPARNMHLLAENLAGTGRLRAGLSVDKAADVIWSMNSSEFYLLLVEQRGWAPEEFEEWLAETWIRLLLA